MYFSTGKGSHLGHAGKPVIGIDAETAKILTKKGVIVDSFDEAIGNMVSKPIEPAPVEIALPEPVAEVEPVKTEPEMVITEPVVKVEIIAPLAVEPKAKKVPKKAPKKKVGRKPKSVK